MYTVYKHTSPSGKIYIGITSRKLFRAIQKYGINHSDIVEVCRGRRKKSKGYRWEYAEKGGDINE